MTRLLFHVDEQSIPTEPDDQIHVWLYGSSPPHPHVGVVGHKVLDIASRLVVRPSTAAMDFVIRLGCRFCTLNRTMQRLKQGTHRQSRHLVVVTRKVSKSR